MHGCHLGQIPHERKGALPDIRRQVLCADAQSTCQGLLIVAIITHPRLGHVPFHEHVPVRRCPTSP